MSVCMKEGLHHEVDQTTFIYEYEEHMFYGKHE